jgi:hypothetical protein
VTVALPFLGVRVAYSVLSVYATSDAKLARFNRPPLGDWKLYLVMSLVMEYMAVVIYSTVGALLPSLKHRHHRYYEHDY